MAFESILPKCPACNLLSLRTTQTVRTLVATRRRKECDSCNYKVTTHEVFDDFFQQAKRNKALIQKLKIFFDKNESGIIADDISVVVSEETENKCPTCIHNNAGMCSFDFPEYDTNDSFDCANFLTNTGDCNDC
jgi:hypothetical protein